MFLVNLIFYLNTFLDWDVFQGTCILFITRRNQLSDINFTGEITYGPGIYVRTHIVALTTSLLKSPTK